MTHLVFICYASQDKTVAEAACSAIESRGIRCWIAPRDIRPGELWDESILGALSASQVVVLIFSSHANDSPEVRREIERAANTGKVILPFRVEEVRPSRALEYWLGNLRWLDAITPPLERHLMELCDAVSRLNQDTSAREIASAPMAAPPPPISMPIPRSAPPQPMPQAAPPPPASRSGSPGWLTSWWETLRSKPGMQSSPTPASKPPPPAAAKSSPRESSQHKLYRVSAPRVQIDSPPGSVQELYRCSAFYPERIEATTAGKIVVSIHLESVAPDVVREAARRLDLPAGDRIKAGSAVPAVRLARHGIVAITMEVPGLSFETTEASLRLWEDQQFAEFRFKPEPSSIGQLCRGWVHFWLEGIVLADVAVAILVEQEEVPDLFRNALAESNARPYRFVFPSYSHEDKEAVERLESYAESFGDTYLRDVRSLRAGQEWNEELRRFIKRAHVFQLFWSEPAARSRYVESEWKFALQERSGRPDPYFVRPIYWTDKPAAIPEELSQIHFARVPLIRG